MTPLWQKIAVFSALILLVIAGFTACGKKDNTAADAAGDQAWVKMVEEGMAGVNQEEAMIRSFGVHTNELLFARDIYSAMSRAGMTNLSKCKIDHQAYAPVQESWLKSEYFLGLQKFYYDNKVPSNWYSKGTFDCGDYADGASWYARAAHRNLPGHLGKTSIAIGVVFYMPYGQEGTHAINVAVMPDKSVIFFEPQTRLVVSLYAMEAASIYWCRF